MREGGAENDAREEHPPGMAGDRLGARPPWVTGPETNTEADSNPMNCAVMMLVHTGRRVNKNAMSPGRAVRCAPGEG